MPTELYEGGSHHSTDRSRSKGPCITNNTRFRPGGLGYEILRRRCSQSPPDTNVRLGWLISKRSIQVTWARPSNYLTSPVHTTSSFQQRLLKMTIQAFYVPTHRDLFIVKLSPRELHLTRSPRRSVFVCGIQPLTCPPPLAIRYWRDNYGLVSFRQSSPCGMRHQVAYVHNQGIFTLLGQVRSGLQDVKPRKHSD